MKKLFIHTVLAAIGVAVSAPRPSNAEPTLEWSRFYDGGAANHDFTEALALDAAGNLLVTGFSTRLNDAGAFKVDIATIKYSPSGDVLWTARFDGAQTSTDRPYGMVVDSSDNAYITGSAAAQFQFFDYLTLKYDPLGNLLWSSQLDMGGNETAKALVLGESGNLYVTGGSIAFGTVKYDSTGQIQWVRSYGSGSTSANSIALDGEENIYVAGTSNPSDTNHPTVVKYNSSGVLQWVRTQNNPQYSSGNQTGLSVSENGDVIVTGYCFPVDPTNGIDYFTIKYDSAGTQLWEANYNGSRNCLDIANAVAVDSSGNVYVTGYNLQESAPNCNSSLTQFKTVKYSPGGNQLWEAQYGNENGVSVARSIVIDDAGNNIVSGISREFSDSCPAFSTRHITTIKYDADGTQLSIDHYPANAEDSGLHAVVSGSEYYIVGAGRPTGCGEGYEDYLTLKYAEPTVSIGEIGSPAETLTLAVNGLPPNQARDVRVSFSLSSNEAATLELFHISGRRVIASQVGSLGAGNHTLNLGDGRRLPAGIYLVRLTQGLHAVSTKAVVVP